MGMESDDVSKSACSRLNFAIRFLRVEFLKEDSIRVFLRRYDEYVFEMRERASQFLGDDNFATESIVPSSSDLRVDHDELETIIDCGFVGRAKDYK